MAKDIRWEITINGIVQGVGFRPFIYKLAHKYLLRGFVVNSSDGVRIEAEGKESVLNNFLKAIVNEKPQQAVITSLESKERSYAGYYGFFIRNSQHNEGFSLIAPDMATCSECCDEIKASGRRYNYAFTNCTNCGPRFTIIEGMPYDRFSTTMRNFTMCEDCRTEYEDPQDRRFHAQPIACPKCGPQLFLTDKNGKELAVKEEALRQAVNALKEGKILAVKGLGGFLLACDATNEQTVATLRIRKKRPHKPLAVMASTEAEIARFCLLSNVELSLLTLPTAPIVLLHKKERMLTNIAANIAPDNAYIGVMLPYTPLHHLLMAQANIPLVMTSGNLSEEPICTDNQQALERLGDIADLFLTHNRPIACGYDDSVAYIENGKTFMVRRARGYAPYPIKLSLKMPSIAAFGSNDKNTFTLTKDNLAFVSAHIGDMGYTLTDESFDKAMALYQRLFKITPQVLAADKHGSYGSTVKARQKVEELKLPITYVQHHHAHMASCMAENGLGIYENVIGLSFDGTGLGDDGHIWGGEVLLGGYHKIKQIASLQYLPLAGGDSAVLHPARLAYGYLKACGFREIPSSLDRLSLEEKDIIAAQISKNINAPLNSSLGRLFDVVAALLGFNEPITYDAQAAIALENMALKGQSQLSYGIRFNKDDNGVERLDIKSILEDLLADIKRRINTYDIARRLHNTICRYALQAVIIARSQSGINKVCLSGGVFANRLLLRETMAALSKNDFEVYTHKALPCNDGCLSLGQAAIATVKWQKGDF